MSTVPTALFEARLTRHETIAPGVFVIGFKRRHDFRAGQAIKLAVDRRHPPRIYSICSGTSDDECCVLFNIKDEGFLTPRLAAMQPGDTVYASEPYGTFTDTEQPAWWIATGTGVAPFHSMVRSGLTTDKVLVHGVRQLDQFYFADTFREKLGGHYHRCCSADSAEGIFAGRVTAFLAQQEHLPLDQRFYLCGQTAMAVEVRDLLIERGVPFSHIMTEIYF